MIHLCSQLQRLIHLMLENLSSLFDSLVAVQQKSHDLSVDSLDNLIPSLCKIRKLSGMFFHILICVEAS